MSEDISGEGRGGSKREGQGGVGELEIYGKIGGALETGTFSNFVASLSVICYIYYFPLAIKLSNIKEWNLKTMKMGIIGLPQVGKKTLFHLMTGTKLDSSNPAKGKFPTGIAKISDSRLEALTELYNPGKTTPATIEAVVIPGIEEGDDKALDTLSQMDVICHVVRAFENPQVFHIKGDVNPHRDFEMITGELNFHDLAFVEKRLERIEKDRGRKSTQFHGEEELLEKLKGHLEEGKPLRTYPLREDQEEILSSYPLITRKEMVLVLNVNEEDAGETSLLDEFQENYSQEEMEGVVISAQLEEELQSLAEEERQDYMEEFGIEKPALERLTQTCYRALGLISFFTVGEDEVRAWAVPKDSTAPRAARAIHTDMERGFIRAEVMKFDELMDAGSEKALKDKGQIYTKGKDYQVEDGDILHILFNV